MTLENSSSRNDQPKAHFLIILLFLFIGLFGGVWLGNGARFFDYRQSVRTGYVRSLPEGIEERRSAIPAFDLFMNRGAKIYSAKCSGCHGSDGKGDGINFPPLSESEWVLSKTAIPAMIILNGVNGEIRVKNKTWNGNMPSQKSGMIQQDLAFLLTYIRNSFGNNSGDLITVEMAEDAWALWKKREKFDKPMNALELKSDYAIMLSGKSLDKETLLDLETLEPVE